MLVKRSQPWDFFTGLACCVKRPETALRLCDLRSFQRALLNADLATRAGGRTCTAPSPVGRIELPASSASYPIEFILITIVLR